MECIICAYPIDGKERLRTVTTCDHTEPICSICYLRLRSLQRNFHCPTCKRELDNVICVVDATSQYSNYSIRNRITIDNVDNYLFDPKGQMFFPKDYYEEIVKPIWLYQCTICQQTRKDFKQLRGHMINEHNIHMCTLCGEFKQVFPKEHRCYSQQLYDQHIRYGDKDGSNGHPLCEFCRKRFYDSTALFFHLRNDHFTCHLCENEGIKFRYFNDYQDLESHFRIGHFLCDDPSCLERRFIVFRNEIDLFAHRKSFHPSLVTDRNIPLNFQYKKSDNVVNATGERVGDLNNSEFDNQRSGNPYNEAMRRERFEGGLGGRAMNGEWQVELQPTTSDPRDPNRYLLRERETVNKEDFPELISANPSGPGSLSGNRWISVRETTGSSKSGKGVSASAKLKGQVGDFPSLPTKPPPAKPKANPVVKKKPPSKDLPTSDIKGIMNYVSSLVEEDSNSTRPSIVADSLGNWVNVKVDKRLNKKKKKGVASTSGTTNSIEPQEDENEGDEDVDSTEHILSSRSGSGKIILNPPQLSADVSVSEDWNSTGFIDTQEAFSSDLAKALQDSLEEYNSKLVEKVAEQSIQEYQKEFEYPTLAPESFNAKEPNRTGSSKTTQSSSTSAKSKPLPKSTDILSALKSVGMDAGSRKPKKSAGISVIKANNVDASKKLIATTRRDDAVSNTWRNTAKNAEPVVQVASNPIAPPPPPPTTEENNVSSKKYGGWVRLGGAEDDGRSKGTNATNDKIDSDFPSLSSKLKK